MDKFNTRACWETSDLKNKTDWIFQITDKEKKQLHDLIQSIYEKDKNLLQEIYDYNFRQLELSIREIGYGDQSINKKMKVYINLFHSIIDGIHFWDDLKKSEKIEKLAIFLEDFDKIEDLVVYFEDFRIKLSKKNLNLLLKGVSTV